MIEPSDDDLAALIKPLWFKVKPSRQAQKIRAVLSTEFDDSRYEQWASSFIPDYVWDLVDIAAQRGLETDRLIDA
jgi:hypothetical protein